jgi:hypothetical protein
MDSELVSGPRAMAWKRLLSLAASASRNRQRSSEEIGLEFQIGKIISKRFHYFIGTEAKAQPTLRVRWSLRPKRGYVTAGIIHRSDPNLIFESFEAQLQVANHLSVH